MNQDVKQYSAHLIHEVLLQLFIVCRDDVEPVGCVVQRPICELGSILAGLNSLVPGLSKVRGSGIRV